MASSELKERLITKAEHSSLDKKPKTIVELINSMQDEIQRALPKHIKADRIARIAITAVRNNDKLKACDPMSFIAALMQSSQLGLEPNTPLGQAYLIPYGREAQFQLGYKGMIDLCRRSGEFKMIYAHEVHKNDEFEYELGVHKDLRHKPARGERGEVTYYYACYHLKDGGYDFDVMSKEDVLKHRDKYSPSAKSGNKSPWLTDFDAMAKKTILKKLLKFAPVSVEVTRFISQDETIKKEIDEDMSIVQPLDIDIDAVAVEEIKEEGAEVVK